jgi:hypothetical protein
MKWFIRGETPPIFPYSHSTSPPLFFSPLLLPTSPPLFFSPPPQPVRYVDGDKEGFASFVESESSDLASSTFGGTLLAVIGYIYIEQADKFLGFKQVR